MRATAKSHGPEDSNVITNMTEEKEEEDKQKERWINPVKCVLIVCFYKKLNFSCILMQISRRQIKDIKYKEIYK